MSYIYIYLDCKSSNLFPEHHFCVASQFARSLNVAVRQGRTRCCWHCASLPIIWHQAPPVTVALSLLRSAPSFRSFVFPPPSLHLPTPPSSAVCPSCEEFASSECPLLANKLGRNHGRTQQLPRPFLGTGTRHASMAIKDRHLCMSASVKVYAMYIPM